MQARRPRRRAVRDSRRPRLVRLQQARSEVPHHREARGVHVAAIVDKGGAVITYASPRSALRPQESLSLDDRPTVDGSGE
jgi:hypothetical protein